MDLFELPDVDELRHLIVDRFKLPPEATLGDLSILGAMLRGLGDAPLGDVFVRLLWAATNV